MVTSWNELEKKHRDALLSSRSHQIDLSSSKREKKRRPNLSLSRTRFERRRKKKTNIYLGAYLEEKGRKKKQI